MAYSRYLFLGLVAAAIGCGPVEEKSATNLGAAPVKTDSINLAPQKTLNVAPAVAAAVSEPAGFSFDNAIFDAPEMLMAGGVPMKAGYSYPSPALFDIDGDGIRDMVLGEIMGTVSVCKNENSAGGAPIWSSVGPVSMANGKPLKLNNW